MSILLVDEMYPGVVFSQKIYLQKDADISHVRPWIYKQGTLTEGDFICRIKDGTTVLDTATISYTEINETNTLNFAHGFMRFDFNNTTLHVPEGVVSKEYIFEFEMINHSKDTTNFIGICRSWDNEIYPPVDTPANSFVTPAGIEIYTYKEKL